MRKSQLQFIIVFLFSIITFCLASPLTFAQNATAQIAQTNAFLDKTFLQNIAITVLSAILAFLGGYALAGISKEIANLSNEDGDVEFISRSATKTLSQRDQVARFLSLLIMYFVIPPIFSILSFSPFNEIIAGIVKLALLLALLRLIVPFSEVIAELISKWLDSEEKDSQALSFLQGVTVEGDLTVSDITQGIRK